MKFDVIIIGAGAAGMMCAAQAGLRGRRVLLIEHAQKLGERIRISGGGRCNFSNREVGPHNFLSQNPQFCRSALARYSSRDFIALVERYGIAYEERDHGQLFCVDSAKQIIAMLQAECEQARVQWAMPCQVRQVEHDTGESAFRVSTQQGEFLCDSLVIACGGLAAPKIGATPFGYQIAAQFGIPVVSPKPALVPLALAPEQYAALLELSGLSLPAGVTIEAGTPRFREDVLLTHKGLSGPAILQISSYWQAQEYQATKERPLSINLLPEVEIAAWLNTHSREKTLLVNLLSEKFPRRFAQAWVALHAENKSLAEFSKADLNHLAQTLQAWTLMPSGTLGYNKAEVTLGGVDTRALSSKTMQANAVLGLFFIGEVVDVTGWLGGYNFQWAWSSGWVAGQAV